MQILNNQNGITATDRGNSIDYKIRIVYDSKHFPTLVDFKIAYPGFTNFPYLNFVVKGGIHDYIFPKPGHGLASFLKEEPFELPPLEGKWRLLFVEHEASIQSIHEHISQTFSIVEALQNYKEPIIYIVEENYKIHGPTSKTYKKIDIARY